MKKKEKKKYKQENMIAKRKQNQYFRDRQSNIVYVT